MFAEQTFGFRPGDTGLQFGLAGHLIDPVQRRISREITARKSLRTGSSPPTTLVPPPNGTTAMPWSEQ
ncbi:Uncharacterised protein [Mycobacterium tuberculosis]|nr:Uncharacterised protein [Mycobacterium tuberculosis]